MVVNLQAGLYRVLHFLLNSLEGYTVELITLQDFNFPLLSSSITFCEFPVAP